MNTFVCDCLDDFLDGDLSADDRVHFEDHLRYCSDCQQAVEDWLLTNELLKQASEQLEFPSAHLRGRVAQNLILHRRIDRASSTQRLVVAMAMALCACAALFVCCVRIPSPPVQVAQHDTASEAPQSGNDMPQHAMLSFPENVISVPVDIGQPNVIVVWTYPTVQTELEQD